MARDGNFIKPGAMKQIGNEYLNLRKKKIDMHKMRLTPLGCKAMADSLVGSNMKAKDKETREKSNMMDLDVDDEEYQPLDGEGSLSSSSNDNEEVTRRALRKRVRAISPPTSTPRTRAVVSVESTVAPTPTPTCAQELADEQDPLSATLGSLPQQMVGASTSRRVQGATRGINTERLIVAHEATKLVVEVPLEVGAPVGVNATRFATWLGVQIRMAAPLKDMEKWDDIPRAVQAPIIQAARDKFDILEYDEKEHVRRGINRKCQKLYRTWRHRMKEHCEALLEAGKNTYSKPYRGVTDEDWAWMIENIWTNKDKEEIAEEKKKAQARLPFNHTMGSKSFAAAMSAQTKERGGQRPPIANFYKSTHFNGKTKKWVAPICEQLHVQLEARHKEDEACCQEVEALGSPVTLPQKEMPIEVLGKKFYVKEYGVGLKPSSSKRSSGQSYEEVRVLTNQVETLKDVCQEQKNQIETLKDLCQTQQEKIQAYDEKFARFETVLCAYMQGGPIGTGSNPQ